jgi:hypothetical protein
MPTPTYKIVSFLCVLVPGGVFAQTAEPETIAASKQGQNISNAEWSVKVGITPKFYYRLNDGPGAPESASIDPSAARRSKSS